MSILHVWNVGQNHNMKLTNLLRKNLGKYKYLGTITNQKYIHEEVWAHNSQGILAVIQLRIFCIPK
jgi:hypothetical protein